MAKPKTVPTEASVAEFIDGIEDERRRRDCRAVLEIMERVTGEPATMWGDQIVGFGSYRYRYESGREGEWMLTGFSPRKRALTLYVMSGFEHEEDLMERLGSHQTGTSCLYLKRLDDVDLAVLEQLIERSVERMRKRSA